MGITAGIPFAEYLKLPGLSASALKHLMRSPLNYKWHLDHPTEPTAAMALGTAAHTAILEPAKLKTDYVLWDGGTRRGKAWDEYKALNASKTILTVDEFADVKGMHQAVRSFAPAMRYLEAGQAETTMQWSMDGRAFRGRVDWIPAMVDGRAVLVDLKTTRDARPFKFGGDAYRLGYHIQAALYCDGYAALTGELPRFVIIAVESKAPFEPAVFSLPDEVIERGREEYQRLVEVLTECEASGVWPPACQDELLLTLPNYAYEQEDNDLTDLGLTS